MCLGGRVAEQLVLGDVSTGAQRHSKASSIARSMVTKFGMSDKLGAIAYGNESDEVFIGRTMAQARSYSEEVAGLIDEEVKAIVDQAYSRCEEILTRCRKELELTAQYLLTHETMSGETFARVFTDPDGENLPPCLPRSNRNGTRKLSHDEVQRSTGGPSTPQQLHGPKFPAHSPGPPR